MPDDIASPKPTPKTDEIAYKPTNRQSLFDNLEGWEKPVQNITKALDEVHKGGLGPLKPENRIAAFQPYDDKGQPIGALQSFTPSGYEKSGGNEALPTITPGNSKSGPKR